MKFITDFFLKKITEKLGIKNPRVQTNDYEICIQPGSSYLANQFPPEGIFINSFPFRVGRLPFQKQKSSAAQNQLDLVDLQPFQLSRHHLIIDYENGNTLVLHDISRLGTIVNGVRIGKKTGKDRADLRLGRNKIIAGEKDSEIIINITVSSKNQQTQ